jgi:hypothetical protein
MKNCYYHHSMSNLTIAEDQQWRMRERRQGLMEIMMLFSVAFLLAGIVIVCLRMDGDGEKG